MDPALSLAAAAADNAAAAFDVVDLPIQPGPSCRSPQVSPHSTLAPCAEEWGVHSAASVAALFAYSTSAAADFPYLLINVANVRVYDYEEEDDDAAAAGAAQAYHTEDEHGDERVLSENDTEPDEKVDPEAAEVCCPAPALSLSLLFRV